MRSEQGVQVEDVKECEKEPLWWSWAQTCRKGMWSKRISGRKEGIGTGSNVAQS